MAGIIHNAPDLATLRSLPTSEIRELVSAYPYVALYRVILAGRSRSENSPSFPDDLKWAALHTSDRRRLYEYLHGEPEILQEEDPQSKVQAAVPRRPEAEPVSVDEPVAAAVQMKEEEVPATLSSEEGPDPEPQRLSPRPENEISAGETHTFLEWLMILQSGKAPEPGKLEEQIEQHKAVARYELELQSEAAELERKEEEAEDQLQGPELAEVTDLANKSVTMTTGLVSETLAQVMLKQGKISEAIRIYELLSLKYPSKSDYFAAQIEKLK